MDLRLSQERFEELARAEIAALVASERPLIREELIKSMQVIDEDAGIAMLSFIKGKDPRRTFRRLMNKYGVEKVMLGSNTGWKLGSLQKLLDAYTRKSSNKSADLKLVA